jgi:hypothetical protein
VGIFAPLQSGLGLFDPLHAVSPEPALRLACLGPCVMRASLSHSMGFKQGNAQREAGQLGGCGGITRQNSDGHCLCSRKKCEPRPIVTVAFTFPLLVV